MTVKKREEDNRKRETTLEGREKALLERERALTERENKLIEREREVARRERRCEEMYQAHKARKVSIDATPAGAPSSDAMDMMDTQEKENDAGAPGVTVVGPGVGATKYPPGTAPNVAGGDRQDIINRIRALRDN